MVSLPTTLASSKIALLGNKALANLKQRIALTKQNPGIIKLSQVIDQTEKFLFEKSQQLHSKVPLPKFSQKHYRLAAVVDLICIALTLLIGANTIGRVVSPLISPAAPLTPLTSDKGKYEVFGFAPYFTFDKLTNVNFKVLTTFAYFGVDVNDDGSLDKESQGYQTFMSKQATDLFRQAHANGTRVVLTLTQMDEGTIRDILDNPDARNLSIDQAVQEVKNRGIDGINVDFEYGDDPGQTYRDEFSQYVKDLTLKMHQEVPHSKVTVSVYASAVKDPKIYDIASLSQDSDGIFMMAYDFAVAGSDTATPTAPLHGSQDGKYWYDVATAVKDFLKYMPANKLILGVPYYGYNYLVYQPGVNAPTLPYYSWAGQPVAQTYADAQNSIGPNMPGIEGFKTGWDPDAQVAWEAYQVADTGVWRMIFLDDPRSLAAKYDFAKQMNLKGVGIWALGFDSGKNDLWALLSSKFGTKIADNSVFGKVISDAYASDGN